MKYYRLYMSYELLYLMLMFLCCLLTHWNIIESYSEKLALNLSWVIYWKQIYSLQWDIIYPQKHYIKVAVRVFFFFVTFLECFLLLYQMSSKLIRFTSWNSLKTRFSFFILIIWWPSFVLMYYNILLFVHITSHKFFLDKRTWSDDTCTRKKF